MEDGAVPPATRRDKVPVDHALGGVLATEVHRDGSREQSPGWLAPFDVSWAAKRLSLLHENEGMTADLLFRKGSELIPTVPSSNRICRQPFSSTGPGKRGSRSSCSGQPQYCGKCNPIDNTAPAPTTSRFELHEILRHIYLRTTPKRYRACRKVPIRWVSFVLQTQQTWSWKQQSFHHTNHIGSTDWHHLQSCKPSSFPRGTHTPILLRLAGDSVHRFFG